MTVSDAIVLTTADKSKKLDDFLSERLKRGEKKTYPNQTRIEPTPTRSHRANRSNT